MRARALSFALALCLPGMALAGSEPEGFRGPPYRAPVPDTVLGTPGLSLDEAQALHAGGVAFVDVLPATTRPDGLPEGTIWRSPPHDTIPGAHWVPGIGYEALAPETERWMAAVLDRISGGDRSAPMVFFCKSDCWMSWNATRRARLMGYDGARWFPEGSEGWPGPLVAAEPEPGAP
ncbi:PQQ-dependent catabolism-associated CXXCW motif protein [Halodurantibacterium flavum]|uniref:PQQ-dependent catabolism-associated CXXCW motif protein n=1 Tax=Halodurantibacterium flavum TaxID=1382802 RepID=A0ABW4S9V7_9RHOB